MNADRQRAAMVRNHWQHNAKALAKPFPKAFGEPFPEPFRKGIDTPCAGAMKESLHCVPSRCTALHVVAVVPDLYTLYRFCTSQEAAGVADSATPVAERATPKRCVGVTKTVTPVTESVTPQAHFRSSTRTCVRVVKTTTPVVNSTTPSKPLRRGFTDVTRNACVTLGALHPIDHGGSPFRDTSKRRAVARAADTRYPQRHPYQERHMTHSPTTNEKLRSHRSFVVPNGGE